MATTPNTVIVVSVSGTPTRVGAVFTTMEAVRAYTGTTGRESQGGEPWGPYTVWTDIPVNPDPSARRVMGGRKKTARRRRRTTRKH